MWEGIMRLEHLGNESAMKSAGARQDKKWIRKPHESQNAAQVRLNVINTGGCHAVSPGYAAGLGCAKPWGTNKLSTI
jgi:hypothetical protein